MHHRDLDSGGVIELQLHITRDGTMHPSINIHHQYDKSHSVSEIIRRVTLVSHLDTVTRAFVSLCEDDDPRSARTRFHRQKGRATVRQHFLLTLSDQVPDTSNVPGVLENKKLIHLEFISNQNVPDIALVIDSKANCHPSVLSQIHGAS